MADIINPYSILLTEEQRIIFKTRKLREDMVDEFVEYNKGLPTKGGDIRVINEVLNSLDDQVLGLVDKRLKHAESESNAENAANMASIFKKLSERQTSGKLVADINIDDKFIPDDIVPGENSVEKEEIELKDILNEDEED